MNRFLNHLHHSGLVFFGRLAPNRGATVFPDDVFLVSYPKSGNTWIRFLVGNLAYQDQPTTFANIERRVPSVYGMPDRDLRRLPRPRYLKSHEPFDLRYQNIIYVVRDPRDVAVSYYHYAVKKERVPRGFPMDSFVANFIVGDLPYKFGTWADHVVPWLVMGPSRRKFLSLTYEGLLEDTRRELLKVAAFLGIDAEEEGLSRALHLSDARRMQDLEERESQKWATTKGSRSDVPFIRAAKSGQWAEALSAESVAAIEGAWGPVMQALGYKLVNDPVKLAAGSETWARWEVQVRAVWPDGYGRERQTRALLDV